MPPVRSGRRSPGASGWHGAASAGCWKAGLPWVTRFPFLCAFTEFEREMIRNRVNAGLDRVGSGCAARPAQGRKAENTTPPAWRLATGC